MTYNTRTYDTGGDPLLSLDRLSRLGIHRAWYEETVYGRRDAAELYPVKDGDDLRLRVPTARIITHRHVGLEMTTPPQFKIGNREAQNYLNRILKLNGIPGAMPGACITKSWGGDVGLFFTWKPTEKSIFGTPWQVGFIEPETYEVYSRYPSGVFKEVDIYTFEDRPNKAVPGTMERWWKRTRYSHALVTVWPEVRGVVGDSTRPDSAAFDSAGREPDQVPSTTSNPLGVIPFVVIQNIATGTQDWAGASDYQHLTQLFHRLNLHLDSVEQGEQIRNRLMLALIDAEEVDVELAAGLTALMVKSDQSGADDRAAQLHPTPLMTQGGTQLMFFSTLLDLVLESARVTRTGSAKELFGNEAASSSALRTYYATQTAVTELKRSNWLGERADFGMSGFVRKLFQAAQRLDSTAPFKDTELDALDYELTLDWPPMFALTAPEQQTLASVAQQANDEGLPPEIVASLWAQVLGANSLKDQKAIADALKRQQEQVQAGLITPAPSKRGILGSGQGDGLMPDGGSATVSGVDAAGR